MLANLADKLGQKWLRLLLVVGLAGMVALSGCTFRGEGEADDDDDMDNNDDNDEPATGEVRGEGSPGLAWIAALGALGGVAYAARRRLN